jgi:uncharacterized protein YndB with AHSA1/START domain
MARSNASTFAATDPEERGLVLTRIFDAPRELVYNAWTEPEHFMRWWGPKGFSTPVCTIDPRPGGVIHFCMRSPEGQDIWCKGVYREVVAPERIVCTSFFSERQPGPARALRAEPRLADRNGMHGDVRRA